MAETCPPGRLGAYARQDEEGYAAVVATGNAEQLSVFIHRAVSFHGGVVLDASALERFAGDRCITLGTYNELLASLRRCEWISWPGLTPVHVPGLKRSVSLHTEPTPTNADSCGDTEMGFGNEQGASEAAPLPAGGADHPMVFTDQALRGSEADDAADNPSPAAKKGKCAGYNAFLPEAQGACCSSLTVDQGNLHSFGAASPCEASASAPSPNQAFAGVAQEVQIDDSDLCEVVDFGPLMIAAPPRSFFNVFTTFSGRMFSLVLRNPRNPRTGLILMSSTSQSLVTQTTQGILQELGDSAAALGDPAFYDTLHYDPALLAAVAVAASSSEGGVGLQQLLGGTGSSSNESASASASSASAAPAAAASAGVAHAPNPEEEHGECPVCFEAIGPGDAAMRCSGRGGMHHYFHASCLQGWIRQCRNGQEPTCPVCRGPLQFNGQRLDTFLQGPGAANLNDEERSFLKSISDGLQHKNAWSDMSTVEKGAFAAGIAAAAGWGFMLGYNGDGNAAYMNNAVVTPHLGHEHQIAQGVGWVAGLLARIIREATKERNPRRNDRH